MTNGIAKTAGYMLLALILAGGVQAQQAASPQGSGDGMAMNLTVFRSDHIKSVTAVTQVFGRSQRITAAIVEYDAPIRNADLTLADFAVTDRRVTRIYANDAPATATGGRDGIYVILELNPEDEAAVVFAPQVEELATVVVSQARPVASVAGESYAPTEISVINTRLKNLIVDDFQQFRFADPETGLILDYNLYIPQGYDPLQSYPLVLFMHDAGATGTNPLRTLEQGLGAVAFASPRDQAKHPAFVLAPQYPVGLANDASQISDYPDITVRLIEKLSRDFNLDQDRLYTTGQSGGCMASIALNIKYPDLFAASLLVAGQWDPAQVAPLAQDRLFVIVSEDDAKAYPGMNAIMDVLQENGAGITRATWNARGSQQELDQAVADIRAAGPGSNVYYAAFQAGTVFPEGSTDTQGASGHVNTWRVAYDIPAVRDWLFEQSK